MLRWKPTCFRAFERDLEVSQIMFGLADPEAMGADKVTVDHLKYFPSHAEPLHLFRREPFQHVPEPFLTIEPWVVVASQLLVALHRVIAVHYSLNEHSQLDEKIVDFVIRYLALIAAASQDDLSILGVVFQEPLICHLRFRGFLTSCR